MASLILDTQNNHSIANALTVDVEDYFHVAAFSKNIDRKDWGNYESRVEKNTYRLLEIFEQNNVKITFFVLGWVAERYPDLVRDIVKSGHELACHGYSHQLIYNQSRAEFREETLRAKKILEDTAQTTVFGYRAASYSVTNKSLWALDEIAEAGFIYDSSIFPVRHDNYGIPGAQAEPHRLQTPEGHSLVEFPLSTVNVFGYKLPIAGGGYFRLYPYQFTRLGLASINRKRQPFIFYLHPWEIDSQQPKINTSRKSRFRHYNNLDKCEGRLLKLLNDFSFVTVKNVLENLQLWDDTNQG